MIQDTWEHAQTLFRAGKLRESELACRQIVDTAPDHAQAWFQLGLLASRRGHQEEATSALRRAVRAQPGFAEAHNNLGIVLAKQGMLSDATACFQEAVRIRPDYAEAHSNLGNALRSQGRVEEAIASLERAIGIQENYPGALHNLGIALMQVGRISQGEAPLRRAIRLKADFAQAHNSLGMALLRQRKFEEAITSFREALRLKPGLANAHNNLGNAIAETGRPEEAIPCYREAIRLSPTYADAYNNLGNALRHDERLGEAATCFEEALKHRPKFAEAHNNLGVTFARQGKHDLAVRHCERATRLRPEYAAAHSNLGISYGNLGEYEKAVLCYRRALEIQPDYAEAYSNLGIVLTQQGRYGDAIAAFERALELKPDYPEAHSNLGIALSKAQRIDEAMEQYERAIAARPDYADAHMNRALTYLLTGDFQRGWPEYEWRWKCKDFDARRFPQPRWRGEPLDGRRILLCTEQGFGDTFEFIRYAQIVKERGGYVIVRCPKPLTPIVRGCRGVHEVCLEGGPLPPFDLFIDLMTLPHDLGTTERDVPADVPYIFADQALVENWRRELEYTGAFKVGIAWQGSPKYRGDRQRSIHVGQFAPLAAVPGVQLISLQKGGGTEQIRDAGFSLTVLGGQFDEANGAFMDTAAIIRNLDLVVSIDSAICHLAGGLAVPVWLAVPHAPDWRWMLGRVDSPWYPNTRLFRQTDAGDWQGVFRRMADALTNLISKQARRSPGTLLVETSAGDLIDRITILRIKAERITDPEKLNNIGAELAALTRVSATSLPGFDRAHGLVVELQRINAAIWDTEDEVRRCEAQGEFGDRFIELARSVYLMNDRRAAVKQAINQHLGSRLVEEKQYVDYKQSRVHGSRPGRRS